jgi:hypothetical protein
MPGQTISETLIRTREYQKITRKSVHGKAQTY